MLSPFCELFNNNILPLSRDFNCPGFDGSGEFWKVLILQSLSLSNQSNSFTINVNSPLKTISSIL